MRDNHLHTYFSYDSEEQFSSYLEAYEGDIVTTEHFDLSNPYPNREQPRDDVPDYSSYKKILADLNQSYGPRLKSGIEIGYFEPREADILDYLSDKEFDLKLLSVHHNGRYDFLDLPEDLPKDEIRSVVTDYFNRLEYAIGRVEADVLAHFDYGFRRFSLTVEDLVPFEEQLKRIFQKMIAHDLAFELNTKSMYLYHHEHLYRYALTLVQDLGGRKLSIGSDGHHLDHFRLHFERIEALLAEAPFAETQWIYL